MPKKRAVMISPKATKHLPMWLWSTDVLMVFVDLVFDGLGDFLVVMLLV